MEPITKNSRFWAEVNAPAREAFPPEEYLAPSTLVKMAEGFAFLALTDGDAFVGFMAIQAYRNLVYLLFLAIDAPCRSKGYGSRAIATLKAAYPGRKQVVDFEALDGAAGNREQRERRRDFYLRNGYRETGLFLTCLGVNYKVFCMDGEFGFFRRCWGPSQSRDLLPDSSIDKAGRGFRSTIEKEEFT